MRVTGQLHLNAKRPTGREIKLNTMTLLAMRVELATPESLWYNILGTQKGLVDHGKVGTSPLFFILIEEPAGAHVIRCLVS